MENTNFIDYDSCILNYDWIIHLDPGHGGMIDGVYQTKGKMCQHEDFTFYEGIFNRSIAEKIAYKLNNLNISHVFTTNSNLDISLPIRVNRINNIVRLYPENKHLLISIHGNAGDPKAKGIEIFTSKGKTKSDEYAEEFFKSLSKIGWKMRPDTTDEDSDKEEDFYIIKKTNCPAVLIEYGFFTNPEEAKLMNDNDVQNDLATLTVEAILNIIKNEANN